MNDDPSRQWQPPSEPANAQDDPPHQQPRPAPAIGFVEWFWPGDFDRVEQILADMKSLGVTDLRTGVSWANWFTPWGERWYAWLLPRLAKEVTVMPCFLYTPPSLGIAAKSSSPPRNTKLFADFVDVMITRFGQCFEYVELWNEANNRNEWDWTLDPYWYNFGEMVGSAAYWARERGKKTVLAGMSPIDPNWLNLMFQRGVMDHIDVVGVHGFPGTMDSNWDGWQANIGRVRRELDMNRSRAEIWITETGFSTWRHDEYTQLRSLVSALDAPVQRVYWYALHDLNPDRPTVEGFHSDERGYHFGLKTANGIPKLLYRIWNGGGLDAVRKTAVYMSNERRPPLDDAVLITGGAGFIGSNLAHRLLENGRNVIIFDNLSRHGVEENLRWLTDRYAERVQVHLGDMRDRYALRLALEDAREVFHFAAQVAVTSSMTDPMLDFGVNALGTLNLLEEARSLRHPPSVVFTSTNKVYGALGDVTLTADGRPLSLPELEATCDE